MSFDAGLSQTTGTFAVGAKIVFLYYLLPLASIAPILCVSNASTLRCERMLSESRLNSDTTPISPVASRE